MQSDGISVVMIGRDASRYLGEALDAVAALAGEIVYVDTGSADESIAIARARGARMYNFAWCNDFAKAKNFGVEQARFSWILSVDTDEVLSTPGAGDILRRTLPGSLYPAYLVYQDNMYDSGEVKPNPVARLFRNDPRIRFRNPVHECISPDVLEHFPRMGMAVLDIHFRHYGYLSENMQGKRERNLVLLRKWAAADPDNAFATFKLGSTLFDLGRPEEALPWLRQTHARFGDRRLREVSPYLATFMVIYHRALLACGRQDEADRFEDLANRWLREGYS